MKKVGRRASATLLIALAVIAGLALWLVRLSDNGGVWAEYFTGGTPRGTITDRRGEVLYTSDGQSHSFASSEATRLACYHLIGDAAGNVGTGALRVFRDKLTKYSFIEGSSGGETLSLTVDAKLNRTAYEALAGRSGVVMLMNYETGEILCMVSTPADDPSNPSKTPADGTYLNKALRGAFVPGSIFKLVTLAAALENIPDIHERSFWCAGSRDIAGLALNCSGIHGSQTIEQALANSCNCAFAELALELGAEKIEAYARRFGLLDSQSLDGVIDTAAGSFTQAASGSASLAWSGIGQFEDLVSPYAMLRFVSAIAAGGEVYEPTLLGHGALDGKTRLLSGGTARQLAAMMDYNVESVYGSAAFGGLNAAAKTGTAELGDGTSHAWITGFLSEPEHPYAFIVLIERGGGGLRNAAPIASAVLQAAVAENSAGEG